MVQLKIDNFDAEVWIQSVSNDEFQGAIKGNWIINEQGYVKAQSVLWLFCWAITGMGSIDAAVEVQEVFDQVCPFTYNFFKTKVDHEGTRKTGMQAGDIKADIKRLLES